MIKKSYHKLKRTLEKYERYLFIFALVFGFVLDNLTLRRVDLWIENIAIVAYLLIVIFCIFLMNAFRKRQPRHKLSIWLNLIAPFFMQFAFGGLFSAFIVFYSRSASFMVSWPFLLILLALLFGNEFFKKRYERLYFNLSILYLAVFAYAVFLLPVLMRRIGADIFLASGAVSLIFIALVIAVLYLIDKKTLFANGFKLALSIVFIYLVFNFLYFANIIPPIPLAMKLGGVYHEVNRQGMDYQLTYEKPGKYEFWRETAFVYHWKKGERVYVFSSIFAPSRFNERIFHRWSFYDKVQKKWIEKDLLSFSIVGGRDNGFRGYSYKTLVEPGKWRVDVMTERGQVLGRIKFEIIPRETDMEYAERVNS